MIVGSLLLILVAVVLLGTGLAQGSNPLLVSSIAASLLAAIALVVGARQAAATGSRMAEHDEFDERLDATSDHEAYGPSRVRVPAGRSSREFGVGYDDRAARRPTTAADGLLDGTDGDPDRVVAAVDPASAGPAAADGDAEAGGPADRAALHRDALDGDLVDGDADGDLPGEDPPDEPPAQQISPADAARVARLATEVLVVDSRPRYHLAGCAHLHHRDSEALPVSEAIELGFTPCGLCAPDSALLAEPRRI